MLRIKPEYIEHSAGISGRKMVKLKNLPVSHYERYYKIFPSYFEVIEEEAIEEKKSLKTNKKNDKNNTGDDSISFFNTDGESDID